MKSLQVLSVLVVLLGVGLPGVAQETTNSERLNKVTINSRGEATGTPDTMRINLYAEATSGNASDALRQCTDKAAAAADAISGLGIAGVAVTREMFQFTNPASADPYSFSPQSTAPTGTKVTQVISVEAPLAQPVDKDALAIQISSVLDAAAKNGVSLGRPVSPEDDMFGAAKNKPVEYRLKDDTALHAAAVKDAMAVLDTLRKQLAEAGVRTGQLLNVQHYKVGASGDWETYVVVGSGEGATNETSDTPESISVAAQISCAFELLE